MEHMSLLAYLRRPLTVEMTTAQYCSDSVSPKPPVDYHVHYCTPAQLDVMSYAIYDIYGSEPVSTSTPKSLIDMSLTLKKGAFN